MTPPAGEAPEGGWNSLKVAELQAELEARGLTKSGKKAELVARLEEDDAGSADAEAPEEEAEEEAPEAAEEPAPEADSSFELVLERSGLTLQVPPDQSVLTVIREAGVSVLASCLEGVCGTCETEVIDGDVDHRDSVLNEEEQASNEYMMVCVSRCRSPRLTLDL